MASRGHLVTAIDLSPTAIAKAIRETPAGQQIEFLVGDVTDAPSLNLNSESYDLAVDVGCLHMMAEDEDRANYLNLVQNILKTGGKFFLENGLDLDDVFPQSEAEARQLAEAKALKAEPAGHLVPNKIMTPDGERELLIPLCPTCKMLSLVGYVQELVSHGFSVLSAERTAGANCRYEAIVVAEKH
jgi:SAM-dependent methyltransferase